MTIPGLLRSGRKIAQRKDGLHALPYYTSADRRVALWTKEADIHTLPVPLPELPLPCCEFVDDRLVICAMNNSGGLPANMTELSLTDPITVLDSFTVGAAKTTWGA